MTEPFVITSDFIEKHIINGNTHPDYDLKVSKSDEILLHSNGTGIDRLLKTYHPSEPQWLNDHRMANYRMITKAPFYKLMNSISKISRSEKFVIKHPVSTRLPDTESLEYYTEQVFPVYDTVKNWFFSIGLHAMLTDPNAVVAVLPINYLWDSMSYPSPFPYIFRSEQVLDFREGEYAIIKTDDKTELQSHRGELSRSGDVYLVITNMEIWKFEQTGDRTNREFEQTLLLQHNFNSLPVFSLGGNPVDLMNPDVYESFISGVVPYWDEAVTQFSDLQGAIKQHMYPEKWMYATMECQTCSGRGKIKHGTGLSKSMLTCESCGGSGVVSSPYSNIIIRPTKGGIEDQAPIPPAGYITKDTEPIKWLGEYVDKLIAKGYSAVNFEFLSSVPLNQSGVAKEFDRQELNSFLHKIAQHIVDNIVNNVYYYTALYRYLDIYNGNKNLLEDELMPKFTIPSSFDVVGADIMTQEVANAKNSGIDSALIQEMQIQIVNSKWSYDKDIRKFLETVIRLDPASGKTEDQKVSMLTNGSLTKEDYVLSSNIESIVKRALEDNKDFLSFSYTQKYNYVQRYVNDYLSQLSGAAPEASTESLLSDLLGAEEGGEPSIG